MQDLHRSLQINRPEAVAKVWLVYLTLLLSLLFLVLPDTIEPYDFFLFSDMRLHFATHVYFICERLVMIALAYIIASESKQYRELFNVYFVLMIGDLIDYILCYNSVWFKVLSVPVSYNIFMCLTFGVAILYFNKKNE